MKFSNTLSSGASNYCPISDIITPLSRSISSLGKVEFFIMSDKMLKFIDVGRQTTPKRKVLTRKDDFNEIYSEYIHEKASEQ